ncbi:AraC family transcriptional regulator [Flammeovirga kamogawensis]|uniref:AraC family transcriptional regulator n=1 Tax=Flammeovirga kamogawensis TaxID=373891 RepID=A0ABX8H0M9_9BACT|nr:AraC family transcriptional regulator [Flammeovirga kamogawensis]MBB6462327.1 AraC-like DNA-binding protein [Flammeovirga kamogawensis]QWG09445.1 AraC family transcriptional regulator [Flammeovirga kamogawensis]TRX64960.1 helix-turn-helix domain-containing protein [Flammeovirga kamogawensis]
MRLLEKKLAPTNKSFTIYRNQKPCLDEQWHFHKELELIYINKGNGLRFIGDHVAEFNEGELVLVGSNLPHLWKNSPEYYNNLGLTTDSLILQFDPNFLGDTFLQMHESVSLRKLLSKAKNGIEFRNEKVKKEIFKHLVDLQTSQGFESMQTVLQILHKLSIEDDISIFVSSGFSEDINDKDSKRLDKVYQFVLENFHRDIQLSEVAELSYLGISPFCRFFKKRTHKPFSQFLNEVRVGHACKLLITNELSISQITYSCGFNSQTNFNRQFKKIKNVSPRDYQKIHLNRN